MLLGGFVASAEPPPEDEAPKEPGREAAAPEAEKTEPATPQPEAVAPPAPQESLPAPPIEDKRKPWRGSRLTYGHTVTAGTFLRGGQPYYDPSWSHHLALEPEWHLNDFVYVRARLFISQDLTLSDTTNSPYLPGLSDLYLYGGWSGYEEPHTRLKIAGDLLVTAPASGASQYRGEILRVGPRAALSRTFDVLAGLTIGYGARPVFHLNRGVASPFCYTTECSGGFGSNSGVDHDSGPDVAFTQATGGRNVFFHVSHGPFVSFRPHETVSIDATFFFDQGWLYALASPPPQFMGSTQTSGGGVNRSDMTRFLLSVGWQFTRPVGAAVSAFTTGGQLAADGTYVFPLFNRFTQFNLDFTLDLEALTSLVL
jgi:hypothetical protein